MRGCHPRREQSRGRRNVTVVEDAFNSDLLDDPLAPPIQTCISPCVELYSNPFAESPPPESGGKQRAEPSNHPRP